MVLTKHQLFHLDAILKEADETRNLVSINKEKWMIAKKIKSGEYEKYLDQVIKDVAEIKKSEVFPDLESASSIHDHIEEETKGEFHGG